MVAGTDLAAFRLFILLESTLESILYVLLCSYNKQTKRTRSKFNVQRSEVNKF